MLDGYILVKLKLLPKQRVDVNKWECMLNGEKRLVTTQWVNFYIKNLSELELSFNKDEVEEFYVSNRIE